MQPVLPRWLLYLLLGMLLIGAFLIHIDGASAGKWNKECRGYSPEKTVKCIASKMIPPGGVPMALSVWKCESYFGTERSLWDHSYHGPYQYALGTYASQRLSMPDVDRWYDLSTDVHDMRSNIVTAVSWATRHGWGPWSCA